MAVSKFLLADCLLAAYDKLASLNVAVPTGGRVIDLIETHVGPLDDFCNAVIASLG